MRIVRYVGTHCDEEAYTELVKSGTTIIDCFSPKPNVTIRFEVEGRRVRIPNLSEEARDLIEFGTFVYMADEISSRTEASDAWNRTFECSYPVYLHGAWRGALADIKLLLRLLSGDSWDFRFPARTPYTHVDLPRRTVPGNWDVVSLFSGGIDSLTGAALLLDQGLRVLLVGHQADGVTAAGQKRIADKLKLRFPGRVELLQVRVARSLAHQRLFELPTKVEISHRPRSLLFLCLACGIADALNVDKVHIPENGLIGLNVPLQISRVGTLSTRTAHPQFVSSFNSLASLLGAFSGTISNPFSFSSKTEVVEQAPEWCDRCCASRFLALTPVMCAGRVTPALHTVATVSPAFTGESR